MASSQEGDEFWDRVEHEMKVSQPSTWRMTMILLRLGMTTVLLSVSYVMFFWVLRPPKGYFFTSSEQIIPPILWVLVGTLFIICGAFLRFRAIGPIVDKLRLHGLD